MRRKQIAHLGLAGFTATVETTERGIFFGVVDRSGTLHSVGKADSLADGIEQAFHALRRLQGRDKAGVL